MEVLTLNLLWCELVEVIGLTLVWRTAAVPAIMSVDNLKSVGLCLTRRRSIEWLRSSPVHP